MRSKHIEEISSKYKQEIQKLNSEGLRVLSKDRSRAIEYAKKGIEEIEPEKLNDDYIRAVASEMQIIANLVLEERAKNRS